MGSARKSIVAKVSDDEQGTTSDNYEQLKSAIV